MAVLHGFFCLGNLSMFSSSRASCTKWTFAFWKSPNLFFCDGQYHAFAACSDARQIMSRTRTLKGSISILYNADSIPPKKSRQHDPMTPRKRQPRVPKKPPRLLRGIPRKVSRSIKLAPRNPDSYSPCDSISTLLYCSLVGQPPVSPQHLLGQHPQQTIGRRKRRR